MSVDSEVMEVLDRLLSSIRRSLRWRATVRETAEWSVVLGTLALATSAAIPTWPRWPWLITLMLGPLASNLRFRQPCDSDLVWWIDRKLGANETILSAWELRRSDCENARAARAAANVILGEHPRLSPRIGTHAGWAAPFVALTFGVALSLPVPLSPASPRGTARIRLADAPELRAIEELAESTEELEREPWLVEASERARQLRESLAEGIEQRGALDDLRELRQLLDDAEPGGAMPSSHALVNGDSRETSGAERVDPIASSQNALDGLQERISRAGQSDSQVEEARFASSTPHDSRTRELSATHGTPPYVTDPSGANSSGSDSNSGPDSNSSGSDSNSDSSPDSNSDSASDGDDDSASRGPDSRTATDPAADSESSSATGPRRTGTALAGQRPGRVGDHNDANGETEPVDSNTIWLRARPERGEGAATWSVASTGAAGANSDDAPEGHSTDGALSERAARAVEREPLPAAYRDQVRNYFDSTHLDSTHLDSTHLDSDRRTR